MLRHCRLVAPVLGGACVHRTRWRERMPSSIHLPSGPSCIPGWPPPAPTPADLRRLVRRIAIHDRDAFAELYDALSVQLLENVRRCPHSAGGRRQAAGNLTAPTVVGRGRGQLRPADGSRVSGTSRSPRTRIRVALVMRWAAARDPSRATAGTSERPAGAADRSPRLGREPCAR
jgi:hypothetical protein